MEPLSLEVVGLSHRHPGADRDTPGTLSFRLAPGGKGLLLGANGSGKSTLLARLVGLIDGPGEVRIGGELLTRGRLRALRRGIGYLWQRPDDGLLLPTVREDVALGPANDGLASEAEAIADRWLDRLGISHLARRRIRELSLGERQLVALAGVLAREPGLLLLDEPIAALDSVARSRVLEVLAAHRATMLVASHEAAVWHEGPDAWRRQLVLA